MRSVPPRGSGWVDRLALNPYQSASNAERHGGGVLLSEREACVLTCQPTRYRVVVLTSSARLMGDWTTSKLNTQMEKENEK
jgi:hypothetical protein